MPRIEETLLKSLKHSEELFRAGKSAEAKDLLELTVGRIWLEILICLRRIDAKLKILADKSSAQEKPVSTGEES
jgi:hypothetical protein